MLRLTNTLSGKKEEFKPISEGEVGMYNCGPTVYDYAHIGNLRSWIMADTIRRALELEGLKVQQVINITDVGHLSGDSDEGEDKMTKALKREGKPLTLAAMREVANFYFEKFKEDLVRLNILLPQHFPFASDHIKENIDLIETLDKKGFTYKTSDGIYFDTNKDADYGKLGGLSEVVDEHSRIGSNPEKKSSRDFALWKFNEELGFEAPFGKGFPGWHIECSAMSRKYLGEHFDIHTGGVDHIPIHHNNEIAQSESACDCKFVNYWVHNAFVNVPTGKMAKSLGNFFRLNDLIERSIHPLAYRYWLLQARYNSPINFTWEAIEAAQTGFRNLVRQFKSLDEVGGNISEKYISEFKSLIEDDLDTPSALALLWEILKDTSLSNSDKEKTILEIDKVLGLNLKDLELPENYLEISELPDNTQKLIEEREGARKAKDWPKADELRQKIEQEGYAVSDTETGPKISLL